MLFWSRAVGNVGFFAAVLILARSLGPTGRGTIAFITVSALVLAKVAGFGMSEATTVLAARRIDARAALLSNLVCFVLASSLVLGSLGFVLLLSLPSERPAGVDAPELGVMVGATATIALIEAGGAFLVGCGRLRRLALITATATWMYPLLLGLVWLAGGLTVTRAALAWVSSSTITVFILVGQSSREAGLARPRPRLLLESLHFGLRAWVGGLARLLNFRTDQILMGFLATEAALGIYAVAVNASEALLYLPAATATALLPVAARAEAGERTEQALRAFRSTALVTTCAGVVAAVLGPVLIPIVFGSAFAGSVTPFLWLVPGAFGFAATAIFSSALMASSAPGRSSIGPFVSLVVGIGLDLVLIPRFGAPGAAAAASLAFLAGGSISLVVFRGLNPFPWRSLLLPRRSDLVLFRALAGLARTRPSPSQSV
jgi:O-antigen/teichoic acid export membrane protein